MKSAEYFCLMHNNSSTTSTKLQKPVSDGAIQSEIGLQICFWFLWHIAIPLHVVFWVLKLSLSRFTSFRLLLEMMRTSIVIALFVFAQIHSRRCIFIFLSIFLQHVLYGAIPASWRCWWYFCIMTVYSTEVLQRSVLRKLMKFTDKSAGNWNGWNGRSCLHPDHEGKTGRHWTYISMLRLCHFCRKELFENRLVHPIPLWDYLCWCRPIVQQCCTLQYVLGTGIYWPICLIIFLIPFLSALLLLIIFFFSPNPVWSSLVQYDRDCIQKGPDCCFCAT